MRQKITNGWKRNRQKQDKGNASYSLADRIKLKKKTSIYRKNLNNVVSKLDPAEIFATLHPTPVENTFFQKLLEYPCLVTLSCLILFVTPWSVAHQALLSILQTGILEWDAMPFSRESSQPRDGTQVSRIAGRFFTI